MQLGKRLRSSTDSPPSNGSRQSRSQSKGWNGYAVASPAAQSHRHRPLAEAELRQELNGMAATVSEVDRRAAERMHDLAGSLEGDEARLRWADVDLRRAFNTEQIAFAYAVRREGGYVPKIVDTVDKVRNVMVLLPVMLTWFALYEATKAYSEYIAAYPEEIRKPFLLLWQEGFGGMAWRFAPSFSTVALMDAAIIAVIIVLTFYSHGRRETQEEAIQKTANSFQTELDNLLAEATIALAPDRAGRPAMLARSVERLAERFDLSSQELLTRLKAEHERLASIANRREREIADFGVFASGMRAGAEETHRMLLDLRQVSSTLHDAVEDLSGEIASSGDYQRSLLSAVSGLERLVVANIQSDAAITRQLTEAAEALADASDRSLSSAETAAQAGKLATDAVRSIADLTSSLAQEQGNLSRALSAQTESNSKLADSLRSGMGGVSSSSRLISDASMALVELREEFSRISQLTQEQTMTLARMLSEQSAASADLSQVARDLGAAGISTSMRQREMNDELSSLVRRLDALTTTLGHVAANLPEGSWGREAITATTSAANEESEDRGGRRWSRNG
jgi:hypothetical protein